MYYELYVDIFFLENIFMDYALLLLTGQLLHWKISPGRILLGSFVGALGACGLLILPKPGLLVTIAAGYVLLSGLMIRIGFAVRERRKLGKGVLCLYGLSFLAGGIFQTLFSRITLPMAFAGMLSILALVLFLKGYQSLKYKTQSMYSVTLFYHEKSKTIRGLKDTGNRLKEPVLGRPVSVAELEVMRELLDEDARLFYIPYHSVGKSSGILPGVTLDSMSIQRETQVQRIERPVIAISKEHVSSQGEYQILLNPVIMDE